MAVEREQRQSMQRAKVGLVGLAVVIVLISFASAIMRTVTRETPVTTVGAPKADVVANMVISNMQAGAIEPVVETGVGVGSSGAKSAASARR